MVDFYKFIGMTLCIITTAFLWGATNPFLKNSSKGFEKISESSKLRQTISEIKYLLNNKKYLFYFILNQFGSIFFYLTLSQTDLSMAAPVINFLSLVFTAIVGHLLGEEVLNKGSFFGIALVTIGASLCIYSKA